MLAFQFTRLSWKAENETRFTKILFFRNEITEEVDEESRCTFLVFGIQSPESEQRNTEAPWRILLQLEHLLFCARFPAQLKRSNSIPDDN